MSEKISAPRQRKLLIILNARIDSKILVNKKIKKKLYELDLIY